MPKTIDQQITNLQNLIRDKLLSSQVKNEIKTDDVYAAVAQLSAEDNAEDNKRQLKPEIRRILKLIKQTGNTDQFNIDPQAQASYLQAIFFDTINQFSGANLFKTFTTLSDNQLDSGYLLNLFDGQAYISHQAIQALFDKPDFDNHYLFNTNDADWLCIILTKLTQEQRHQAMQTFPDMLINIAQLPHRNEYLKNFRELLDDHHNQLILHPHYQAYQLRKLAQKAPESTIMRFVVKQLYENQTLVDTLTTVKLDNFSILRALMENTLIHAESKTLNQIWYDLEQQDTFDAQHQLLTHLDYQGNTFLSNYAQRSEYNLKKVRDYLVTLNAESFKQLWSVEHADSHTFLSRIIANAAAHYLNSGYIRLFAGEMITKLRYNITDDEYPQWVQDNSKQLYRLIQVLANHMNKATSHSFIRKLLYKHHSQELIVSAFKPVFDAFNNSELVKDLIPVTGTAEHGDDTLRCILNLYAPNQLLDKFGNYPDIKWFAQHNQIETFINVLSQQLANNQDGSYIKDNSRKLNFFINYLTQAIDFPKNAHLIEQLLNAEPNNNLQLFKQVFNYQIYQPESETTIHLTQKLIPIVEPDTLGAILNWYSEGEQLKNIGGERGLLQLAIHGQLDQAPHLLQKCLQDEHSQQRFVDRCTRHSESFLLLCQNKNPQAYEQLKNNWWYQLTDHNKHRLLTAPQTHYPSSFIRQQWGQVNPSQSLNFIHRLLPKDTGLALATLAPFFNSFSDKDELTNSQHQQAVAVYKHLILPFLFNQTSLDNIAHQSPSEAIQTPTIDQRIYHYLSCPFAKSILRDTIQSIHQDDILSHKQSNQIIQHLHNRAFSQNDSQSQSLFYYIVHQRRYTPGSMGEYGDTETFNLLKQLNNNPHKFFQNGPDSDNEGNTMELQEFHNGNLPRASFSSNNSSPFV